MLNLFVKEIILRQHVNKKNTTFKNSCFAKHYKTLHECFMSNQKDTNKKGRKKNTKQNSNIQRKEDKNQSFTGMTKESSKGVRMQNKLHNILGDELKQFQLC